MCRTAATTARSTLLAAAIVVAVVGCGAPPASPSAANTKSGVPVPPIETEQSDRGASGGCAPIGPFVATLATARDGEQLYVTVNSTTPAFPGGFPPVVWPFGFIGTADGHSILILTTDGKTIRTGDTIEIAGTVIGGRFHVCAIDGIDYF